MSWPKRDGIYSFLRHLGPFGCIKTAIFSENANSSKTGFQDKKIISRFHRPPGAILMSEKENFSFSSRKLWTLDFSFSSQNRGTGFNISLSLLENGDIVFTFSFSSRSLSIENPFLFLLSKVEHILLEFSFPSRNWRKEFPVSLSSLETGEKNF